MVRWRRKPEIVEWIKRIELRPGDVLALKVNRSLTAEQAYHVRAQLAEALPQGQTAILLQNDMDIAVIAWEASA